MSSKNKKMGYNPGKKVKKNSQTGKHGMIKLSYDVAGQDNRKHTCLYHAR